MGWSQFLESRLQTIQVFIGILDIGTSFVTIVCQGKLRPLLPNLVLGFNSGFGFKIVMFCFGSRIRVILRLGWSQLLESQFQRISTSNEGVSFVTIVCQGKLQQLLPVFALGSDSGFRFEISLFCLG